MVATRLARGGGWSVRVPSDRRVAGNISQSRREVKSEGEALFNGLSVDCRAFGGRSTNRGGKFVGEGSGDHVESSSS